MTDDSSSQKSLSELAELALRDTAREVVEEARRLGQTVVVWRQGAAIQLPVDEIPAGPLSVSSETHS